MAHQVVLTWDAPTTGDPVVSYDVQRAPATGTPPTPGAFASIASPEPTGTTYTDLAVVAGASYFYRVASVNASGESSFLADPTVVVVPLAVPQPPTNLAVVAS